MNPLQFNKGYPLCSEPCLYTICCCFFVFVIMEIEDSRTSQFSSRTPSPREDWCLWADDAGGLFFDIHTGVRSIIAILKHFWWSARGEGAARGAINPALPSPCVWCVCPWLPSNSPLRLQSALPKHPAGVAPRAPAEARVEPKEWRRRAAERAGPEEETQGERSGIRTRRRHVLRWQRGEDKHLPGKVPTQDTRAVRTLHTDTRSRIYTRAASGRAPPPPPLKHWPGFFLFLETTAWRELQLSKTGESCPDSWWGAGRRESQAEAVCADRDLQEAAGGTRSSAPLPSTPTTGLTCTGWQGHVILCVALRGGRAVYDSRMFIDR